MRDCKSHSLPGQVPLKPLLLAYACNPFHGSEEGVGWNWVKVIASFSDPWVITANFHKDDIERYRKAHPLALSNVRFVYVAERALHYRPTPGWKRIEHSVFKPLMNLAYARWLVDAFDLAATLHRKQHFDLMHQLTYVGYRFPGRLWRLGTPFVWGPIGGLENTPWRFLPQMGWYGALYYGGRNLINSAQRLLLRNPRRAFEAAGPGVIAATSGIQRQIRHRYGVESRVICEVGPPDIALPGLLPRLPGEPLRLVWSGEHLPGKALPLLLRALAKLDNGVEWRLDLLGAGPLTGRWQRLARELAIDEWCRWHGNLPREQALAVMGEGDLFIITSLKDLTSTVLLEALALGLPVICPDHCGFADVVTNDCGIKVSLRNPHQFIGDLTAAVAHLESNEAERYRLARGALHRVQAYAWEAKATAIAEIYEAVIDDS